MNEKQKVVHIQVRLSPEEHDALRKLAHENARSLNGEILLAIRAHIKQQKGK